VPIYEYECESCEHRFEVMQKFSAKPIKNCPRCGAPVHKVLSAPALLFKGTGWYVTDYANADRKKALKAESEGKKNGNGSKSSAETSSSPKTETKD